MLISMTGFGSASADDRGISCAVELRAVNNRFFKAVIKLPDKLTTLEPEIDRILRDSLVRGSIVLNVSVKDRAAPSSVSINDAVLKTYLDKIQSLAPTLSTPVHVDLAHLLMLPGVVEAGEDSIEYVRTHQDLVIRLVKAAITNLNDMRRREGAALWADLQRHIDIIRAALAKIALQAPTVAKTYHERLRARVNQMVADAKLSLSDHDLLKEVALFADRADISEEITRLTGHLDQFLSVCQKDDGTASPSATSATSAANGTSGDGRKLDFIAQEMLREANTIASKANDTTIARLTVDIKSAIDRIKEQVQNAE
jgi:uncharacterized protein (TIGR00255 family)